MQPQTVKVHVAQISEVTLEFVEKMRALRDPKSLELPANFVNELYKWALECEYTRVYSRESLARVTRFAIPLEEAVSLTDRLPMMRQSEAAGATVDTAIT